MEAMKLLLVWTRKRSLGVPNSIMIGTLGKHTSAPLFQILKLTEVTDSPSWRKLPKTEQKNKFETLFVFDFVIVITTFDICKFLVFSLATDMGDKIL